ncbi:FAM49B [Cordylochernes scorpioides]|uniref:FAM49B n=1 Tax=Cordylochernes scorpioides TaxID=51811 RepID=A0ABY6LA18_9ARAC|nr:FAM49B [Cordylochernes scorpioides]
MIIMCCTDAQPTEGEKDVYAAAQKVLHQSREILQDLQMYKGAVNEIREAITNPRSEISQTRAWEAVLPLVFKLKHFYMFSQEIADVVPRLLWQLCSGPMTPTQHLETQQALVKQFAEILDFVLRFDDLKMTNPAIQNDFSYYRRTVSRLRLANQDPLEEEELPSELANRMSLFYAHATPMLRVLSEATSLFVTEHKELPVENTTETLGTMARVCQRMVENPFNMCPWCREFCSRFQNEETLLFVLRVMVGVIILYDHVHPVGAFVKSAHLDVKGSIRVLRDQPPTVVEGLLNALR